MKMVKSRKRKTIFDLCKDFDRLYYEIDAIKTVKDMKRDNRRISVEFHEMALYFYITGIEKGQKG